MERKKRFLKNQRNGIEFIDRLRLTMSPFLIGIGREMTWINLHMMHATYRIRF